VIRTLLLLTLWGLSILIVGPFLLLAFAGLFMM